MRNSMRLAGALLIILAIVEAALPTARLLLPIGGGQIEQMAILFGSAFAIDEILASLRKG